MSDSVPPTDSSMPANAQSLLKFEAVFAELRAQDKANRLEADAREQEKAGRGQKSQAINESIVASDDSEASLSASTTDADDRSVAKDSNRKLKQNVDSSGHVTRRIEKSISILDELGTTFGEERPCDSKSDEHVFLAEAILEFSHDAIVVLEGFKVVSCNRLAENLFGINRDQSQGESFLRLIAKNFDVSREWLDTTIRQLRSNQVVEQEIRRVNRETSVWYEVQLKTFRMGKTRRMLVLARDISQRKQYELELARSRDFLNNTLNAVPEALSVKSSELEIVLVNDAFCETHDVKREEVIGKSAQLALPRSYSSEVALHEQHVLDTGEHQAAFEAFIDANHDQFILSTYRSAFQDQTTGNPYVVAVSRDVTTEMKRENRLQLLASVFENAQEGVAILNPDGAICEANPEFIATIGKAHAKILGTSLEEVVNCRPHQFSEIISLARAGRPWFGYVKMVNKRGEEIACWLSLSPSMNRRGETTNLIAMFSDITQIEDTRRELHRQALHDNLTDLPNRRFYRQKIAELIESDINDDVRFGVCFLDLDDFKIVNDTLGHDAGDTLLVEVSRRVRDTLGADHFLARFGGDEFALLVPEKMGEELTAHACAESVVDALSKPFNLAGHEVHIGVSVGTTIYPDHAMDVESLMRHADVAMYRAKDEGKNKVTFFSTDLVEIVEKRQRLLSELRCALDKGDLTVVYQPKLNLKNNRVTSCEALVRWTKADGSSVSPNEFIPLAEDFGLINRLGQQVLETVCRQARAWFDAGVLSGPIAVNLSPRQLKEPNFLEHMIQTMQSARCEPSWIELEITENAVMEDVDRALASMHRINELGVSIAMDDFGTGYSSLSYIRDFPIKTLKIDTTFVKDLPTCSRAVAIAKTVLSLGHGLDLNVVAEGVETMSQLDFLREAGCDMVQGYLISRPLNSTDYLKWLQSL